MTAHEVSLHTVAPAFVDVGGFRFNYKVKESDNDTLINKVLAQINVCLFHLYLLPTLLVGHLISVGQTVRGMNSPVGPIVLGTNSPQTLS